MTGRGEGYCAYTLPGPEAGGTPLGYAGRAGVPGAMARPYGVRSAGWVTPRAGFRRLLRWPRFGFRRLGGFGRGRRGGLGFGMRRGRGRGRW